VQISVISTNREGNISIKSLILNIHSKRLERKLKIKLFKIRSYVPRYIEQWNKEFELC